MERLLAALLYLRESPMLGGGLAVMGLILVFALAGPLFVDTDAAQPLSATPRLAPSGAHPFGTDDSGRDLLAVMVVGVPLTLRIGFLAGRSASGSASFSDSSAATWAARSMPSCGAPSTRC